MASSSLAEASHEIAKQRCIFCKQGFDARSDRPVTNMLCEKLHSCHTDCLLRNRGGNVRKCASCLGFLAATVNARTPFGVDDGTCEVTANVYRLLVMNEFAPVVEGMVPGASEDFTFANEEASVRVSTGVVDPDLASSELLRRQMETHLRVPRTTVDYWTSHNMDHISTFVAAGVDVDKWLEWNQPMSVLVQIPGVTFDSLIEDMDLSADHLKMYSETTSQRLFAAVDIAKAFGDIQKVFELCDKNWATFALMEFTRLELVQLKMSADWFRAQLESQQTFATGKTMSIEDLFDLGNEWATAEFLMENLKVDLHDLYLYSDAYTPG